MHPVLIEIKGFTFYTYGLIMAVGFLAAYALILHLARRGGEDPLFYENLFLWIIVFGIVGAKLLYLIVEGPGDVRTFKDFVSCLRGGLVWYGGVILNLIFLYFYCRRHEKSFLHVIDLHSAPMMLGLAIGRWGCLMAGCCHGRPTDLPFPLSITYPLGVHANAVAGVPVHPVPLYASLNALVIAAVCYLIFTRANRPGLAAYTCLVLYSITRFLIEFIRGDDRGWFIPDVLSTSQFVGILIFIPSVYLFIRALRKPSPGNTRAQKPESRADKTKG